MAAPTERYLDLLNGRCNQLTEADVPTTLRFSRPGPETQPLQMSTKWLISYITVAKIAVLERNTALTGKQRLEHFLSWVHEHFAFNPPLILISSQFYGDRRDKSIIRGIRTGEATKLKRQLRNAAWDLHILLDWHIRVKSKELCVLASRDFALRKLADKLRTSRTGTSVTERLLLADDWPRKKDLDHIWGLLKEYNADLENPTRSVNRGMSYERHQNMRKELEEQLGIFQSAHPQFFTSISSMQSESIQ